MSIIPATAIPVSKVSPRRLLIYSVPKSGKTSTILKLPNLVHLDLEGGAKGFYEGRIVEINSYADLVSFFKEAAETNFHTQFLSVDTVSRLEIYAKDYAAFLYRKTPMGKNWNGKDITTLPNGAGYLYLRNAVLQLINKFQTLCDNLILIGHIKYTNLSTDSEEVIVKELSLTGKLKDMVMADSDAIAFMYPGKESNERYLSFVSDGSTVSGSRVDHLSNKRILISKKNESDLETYWNVIYPELD